VPEIMHERAPEVFLHTDLYCVKVGATYTPQNNNNYKKTTTTATKNNTKFTGGIVNSLSPELPFRTD
jgi:hypothetical protein